MKLLIVGSRGIDEFDLTEYVSNETNVIITGGACGIDAIAEKFADDHRLSKIVLRPEYRLYKRGAPLKRNELMVDMCDEVLAVWNGSSHGTRYTIEYAKSKNKKLKIVKV